MAQMVPLNKLSKKAQKEHHAKQRSSWYGAHGRIRTPVPAVPAHLCWCFHF